MKKTAFAIFMALILLSGLAACDRGKIEIQEPKEEPVSEAFNEETNIENPSEPEEPAEEPETVPPTAETAEDVAGEFLSRKFGEDKNKIFFDDGILPCGDGFFAICRIDGMNYAIYTDGKSFVKSVKLEHEHAVMQENYSDNGALLTANGLTVTMTDMKIGEKLVIDFDKETYEHFFCPTEESLDYEFGTSADKKYTLWKLHPVGRGDISRYRLALQNNGTGEIRVIEKAGISGGIYGSNSMDRVHSGLITLNKYSSSKNEELIY